MPTPTYEQFRTLTVSIGAEGFTLTRDLTPTEAREFAAELIRWAEVVEQEVAEG